MINLTVPILLLAAVPILEYVSSSEENIEGKSLRNPQGLAINIHREEFLVADALNDRVVIFDTSASFIYAFGLGESRKNPFGIAVDFNDEIIIGGMDNSSLWIYDYSGNFIDEINLPEKVLPGRLACVENSIFAIDRASSDVVEFDRNGKILNRIASRDVPFQPAGLCFDSSSNLLISSSQGMVVSVFDPSGLTSRCFGRHGNLIEDYSFPASIAVDHLDRIWVIDSFRHQLKCLKSNGTLLEIFGKQGVNPGEFYYPVDLKFTPSGHLGVLEKGSGRLQIFKVKNGAD